MSKQLNRRTVLRGIGTAMALPMLEAMLPQQSAFAMTAAPAPKRAAFIFFPNGAIMDKWRPSGTGSLNLSQTLQPLAKHRNNINVFSGLTQHHARANGDGAGDHARSASAFLTGAQPRKNIGRRHQSRSIHRPGNRRQDRDANSVAVHRTRRRPRPERG